MERRRWRRSTEAKPDFPRTRLVGACSSRVRKKACIHDRSVQTRSLPFVLCKDTRQAGSDWDVPQMVLFVQISTLWRRRTLEAVLVTSTASLVRTTASGYLDHVSTVGGKVGSAVWAGTSIHWLGNWFSHIQACWKFISQSFSKVTSMGVSEKSKQRAVLHHEQIARSGPRRSFRVGHQLYSSVQACNR